MFVIAQKLGIPNGLLTGKYIDICLHIVIKLCMYYVKRSGYLSVSEIKQLITSTDSIDRAMKPLVKASFIALDQ